MITTQTTNKRKSNLVVVSGDDIRKLRMEAFNMTGVEFSTLLNVPHQTLHSWENKNCKSHLSGLFFSMLLNNPDLVDGIKSGRIKLR